MKPSLQLKFSQQLTMTPQLQQAIRLLQLSTLDLQQEIQDALDANPLLEVDETPEHNSEEQIASLETVKEPTTSTETVTAEPESEYSGADNIDSSEAMDSNAPDELPVDTTWDEMYSASSAPSSGVGVSSDDEQLYQGETSDSIHDHLLWQMRLTPFSETDQAIALAIIDSIDETGYLTVSSEEILESLDNEEIELDEVEAVRKRIQHFDPIGSASITPQECLLVQLGQYPEDTPWLKESKAILTEFSDLLMAKDFRTLIRKSKLREEQLKEVFKLLQTLNPHPGNTLNQKEPDYVIPDVSVTKKSGRWIVELNPESVPKLNINQQYAALSKDSRSSSDGQFIRSHIQEAKWFIKSIESRNDTLLKVANCIVQQQQGFFEHGPEMMKPMVLNDVAEMVDMHESTISRVTTQKYMHTPRGIYELKYFFSSHVATENGGECSSTAIRALIKKLVAAENPAKPLSDSKIAQLLADQGIMVARRTIAKYRESLSIPPSNQRKSLV
jgi:RNA polymerase sigma-54 factor